MRLASMPPVALGLSWNDASVAEDDLAPLMRVGRGPAILPLAAAEA